MIKEEIKDKRKVKTSNVEKTKFTAFKLASFFLRIGISIVFLYAGVSALLNPTSWVGFIPIWLREIIPVEFFLPIHAVLDVLIGLWLVSGKKTFYASFIASLSLLAIIAFNVGALDIIFRDISILLSAVSLMILHSKDVRLAVLTR